MAFYTNQYFKTSDLTGISKSISTTYADLALNSGMILTAGEARVYKSGKWVYMALCVRNSAAAANALTAQIVSTIPSKYRPRTTIQVRTTRNGTSDYSVVAKLDANGQISLIGQTTANIDNWIVASWLPI